MKHESEQGEYRKYRKQTGPGKGDKRRPTDDKTFRDNFDEIDWGHGRNKESDGSQEPRANV
jgi:hypothetical protein